MSETDDRTGPPLQPIRQGGYAFVVSEDGEEGVTLSPVGLVNLLLRHRRKIVAWGLVCGLVAGILTALLRGYKAEASFAPQTNGVNASSFSGLAAQFGVNLSSLGGGPSLDYFADVTQSRQLLTEASVSTYHFSTKRGGADSLVGTLVQLYDRGGKTPEERLQRAVRALDKDVSVSKDEDGGIVTIEVHQKWPELAEQVARRLLVLVNDFNLNQQQSQASAERAFVGGRVAEIHAQLDSAEDEQRRFFEDNRTYQSSPRLTVEAQRLQRRVDFLQQLYLTLDQAYEQARIQEVRNTPVITIVDQPEGSAKHTTSLALNGIIGAIFGAAVGFVIGFLTDYGRRQQSVQAPAFEEYVALRRDLRDDLAALPRRVGALLGRKPR